MPSLLIPSGTEGDGADGARCHGIVMFLVRLHVLAKLDATMFVVVDAKSSDNGTRTESLGDAVLVRERIQPEDAEENHFDKHPRRVFIEWGRVVVAASPFFCGADESLNIGDMLVFATDVKFAAQVSGNGATGAFEFGVSENHVDAEPSFAVHAVDAFECVLKADLFSIIKGLCGDEVDLL